MNDRVLIDKFGFREYDARWIYEKDINKAGIKNLGKGLGSQIINNTNKKNPRVIVGHDYRSYSEEIKIALKEGLKSTGCKIEDVGLSLSPMVYFAQFKLEADAVAMVTASHNENGWTGVKMGIKKGLTHAPEEMNELKEITLNQKFISGEGSEKIIKDFQQVYKDDLTKKNKINKKFVEDLSASFQKNITEILIEKLERGIKRLSSENKNIRSISVVGGVSNNKYIRSKIENFFIEKNIEIYYPIKEMMGDNAAMIAWACMKFYKKNRDDLFFKPMPRLGVRSVL